MAGMVSPEPAATTGKVSKPKVGVPVWRTGKPDSVLAASVEVARAAVRDIATDEEIGTHLGARSEGERVVTHLFECRLPGYIGWQWFAVLARVSRSKVATVDEVGLLPSDRSVLAPEWVPWADRVRPGDDDGGGEGAADGGAAAEAATAGDTPNDRNANDNDRNANDADDNDADDNDADDIDGDDNDGDVNDGENLTAVP